MGVGEQPQAQPLVRAWREKEHERGRGGRGQDHRVCYIRVPKPEEVIGCHSLLLVFNGQDT